MGLLTVYSTSDKSCLKRCISGAKQVHKNLGKPCLRFFVSFGGSAALCAILSAHNNIMAQIHTAEAQVCANGVRRHKMAILLAP